MFDMFSIILGVFNTIKQTKQTIFQYCAIYLKAKTFCAV